jgi:hypothetical protein
MSSQNSNEPEPDSNIEEVMNELFLKSLNTGKNSALYGRDF